MSRDQSVLYFSYWSLKKSWDDWRRKMSVFTSILIFIFWVKSCERYFKLLYIHIWSKLLIMKTHFISISFWFIWSMRLTHLVFTVYLTVKDGKLLSGKDNISYKLMGCYLSSKATVNKTDTFPFLLHCLECLS